MRKIITKIRSWFAWELITDISGVNHYYENKVTGDRTVVLPGKDFYGFQPINWSWLREARGSAYFYDRYGDRFDVRKNEEN